MPVNHRAIIGVGLALWLALSGCVVVVNYTGDAAADLALIFDMALDLKGVEVEEVKP